MSYKFTKGSQIIGDLKAADDTERNTIIDFGEDKIELQTGGTTRLTIENNVITATTPLHISASVTAGLRISKNNANYREIQFENDGSEAAFIQIDSSEGLVIGNQTSGQEIGFYTTGGDGIGERMRIGSNGYVGVKVTNPLEYLHVGGNGKFDGDDVRIKLNADTDSHPGLELYENGTRKWIVYNDYTDDKLTFKTNTDVNMVIEQDGKVGIGTNSPSHKLDIDGDIRVRGNDIRDNSGDIAIRFDGSANTSVSGSLTAQGAVYKNVTVVTTTTYDVLSTDYVILVGGSSSGRTINLPSIVGQEGRVLIIKDQLRTANSNNIRVEASGSENIDGQGFRNFQNDGKTMSIICGSDQWYRISEFESN